MKKIAVIVFLLLLYPMTVYADYGADITEFFPDMNLRQAILEHINETRYEPVDVIFTAHVVDIPALQLRNRGISDLAGLANLGNLHTLNISANNISELDLTANINLVTLLAYDNISLERVDLSTNINLEELNLLNTPVLYDEYILLPPQLGKVDPEVRLFTIVAQPVDEYGDLEGEAAALFPGINVEGIKQDLFNALNVEDLLLGTDESMVDEYLRVRLVRGPDDNWFVLNAAVFIPEVIVETVHVDPQVLYVTEDVGIIVTVFAWVLALSAILSLVLGGILFALRKE